MDIERLYELLEKIPKTGAINIARRLIISQKIYELEKKEQE